MVNVGRALKDILCRIGLIADYTVETGVKDGWTYVKKQSGLVYLYGSFSKVSGTWSGGTNVYYGPENTVNLPFALKEYIYSNSNVTEAGGAVVWSPITYLNVNSNNEYISFYSYFLRSFGGNGSVTISYKAIVIGKWK